MKIPALSLILLGVSLPPSAFPQSFVSLPADNLPLATPSPSAGSMPGLALLSAQTAATVALGPLGVAASTAAQIASDSYTAARHDGVPQPSLITATQPIAAASQLIAHSQEWSGGGSYRLSAPLPQPTGPVPNQPGRPGGETLQSWALGAEATALQKVRAQAVARPIVKGGVVSPVARTAPRALELN